MAEWKDGGMDGKDKIEGWRNRGKQMRYKRKEKKENEGQIKKRKTGKGRRP